MQPAEPPPPLVLPPLWLLLPLPLLLLLQQLLLQLPSGALGIRKRAPEEERAPLPLAPPVQHPVELRDRRVVPAGVAVSSSGGGGGIGGRGEASCVFAVVFSGDASCSCSSSSVAATLGSTCRRRPRACDTTCTSTASCRALA